MYANIFYIYLFHVAFKLYRWKLVCVAYTVSLYIVLSPQYEEQFDFIYCQKLQRVYKFVFTLRLFGIA